MNERTKIILGVLGVVAAIAVILFNVLSGPTKPAEPEETKAPSGGTSAPVEIPGSSTGGNTDKPTEVPEPSDGEDEQGPLDSEDGEDPGTDGEHTHDGESATGADGFEDGTGGGSDSADVPALKALGTAAVKEYSTIVAGESAAARAARLAPYFADGSSYLTSEPRISNPWDNEGVDLTGIDWGREPLTGVNGQYDSGFSLTVVAPYTAHYLSNGKPLTVIRTGVWEITVSPETMRIVAFNEPTVLN
ncbi:hypothetical protein [Leifsonia sp. Leaf264]|uniref:hypothetical protein n=1 Tax=Leifsonia sp. Leaf264 TaxID=1736314 RepID=UPI0006FB1DE5|nr:hypothetical protein [Leifsonia sp. Leaf264]KQO98855.1 hypothetical protein ASF30_12395 [Leifsonia sp. Leaf264]